MGDAYTYLAYKRKTDFFVGFTVGKWNEITCDNFYKLISERMKFPTNKNKITIFSDGNRQNITGIKNNFPQGCVNYAVKKKIREGERVVGIINKVIFGKVSKDEISITKIDGFCSKLRERISCFTRKGRGFAKNKVCIEQRVEILGTQHNFIEKKRGETPAMKEGISKRVLTWSDILHTRLSYLN